MKGFFFLKIRSIVLLSLCIFFNPSRSYCAVDEDYKMTIHNVGQGNCVSVVSPTKKVLFVDAGSSSTRGVSGITDEKGKYRQLANKIVGSVERNLSVSHWLYFIISHPDQDHLNLVQYIITVSGLLTDTGRLLAECNIGVLFGGKSDIYARGEGKTLLLFLSGCSIPFWFGSDQYKLEESSRLFYVPKDDPMPILSEWDGGLEFLSVGMDAAYLSSTTAEENSNAASIVVKLQCGGTSVTLTGDKTKKEKRFITNRFKERGLATRLESDILLATHHGSGDEFFDEWVRFVNPQQIIFSAGRASFCHPRSEAVSGYVSNAARLQETRWHPIQFYGPPIDLEGIFRSFATETTAGDKSTGYTHALTNRAVFATGNHGDISYLFSSVRREFSYRTEREITLDLRTTLYSFLISPRLIDDSPLSLRALRLDGLRFEDGATVDAGYLIPILMTHTSLEDLSLNDCGITNEHVGLLCDLIHTLTNLAPLSLRGAAFDRVGYDAITEAWDSRKLIRDPRPTD